MSAEEQALQSAAVTTHQESSSSALDEAIQSTIDKAAGSMPATVSADRKRDIWKTFLDQVMKGVVKVDKNVIRTLQQRVDEIDAVISKQLAAIMHNPDFQKLEGTWRGLFHLVDKTETCATLKLKILNVSKRVLFKDLEKAVEWDQSTLFKRIYEDGFGIAGGEPFGALIGDYEFTNHPEDIELLEKMSGVAAGAFCPFISAASPELFGFQSFTELSKPRDLEKIFLSEDYIKWTSYRNSEDSRFVVLTMPRVLSRLPYGKNTKTIDQFSYEEVELDKNGRAKPVQHDHYAWMNAAYVYGANMTAAFAKTNWCTSIRGYENGGKVEGLPAHIFMSDEGDLDLKCPTEVGITDRRVAELSKLGFLPLAHYKNTDYSVFFDGQTTQKPKEYVGPDGDDATANAKISARIPYLMAVSRISHYLKVIGRNKLGAFMERSDLERFLRKWVAQYVLADENADPKMKAKFPLAEARIDVEEDPRNPGSYSAVAYLRPWLQMEELNASMRMVARIPKP